MGTGAAYRPACPPPHTHALPFINPSVPSSAQVLGHAKTVSVLLGGWALFGDVISARQAFGMAVAVAGMVAYGVATAPPATTTTPGAPATAVASASASSSSRLATSPRTRATSLSPAPKNGGAGLGGGGGENVALSTGGGGSPGKVSPARVLGGLAAATAPQPLVDFNKLRAAAAGSALFGPMLKAVGLDGGKDDDGFKIRAHGGGGVV